MICKTCNQELSHHFFARSVQGGVTYYSTKRCKLCRGIKRKFIEDRIVETKIELSSDCKKLLYRIKLNDGDVGVIDCYKIIHNYLIYFDYFESAEDTSVRDELSFMWWKLKELE